MEDRRQCVRDSDRVQFWVSDRDSLSSWRSLCTIRSGGCRFTQPRDGTALQWTSFTNPIQGGASPGGFCAGGFCDSVFRRVTIVRIAVDETLLSGAWVACSQKTLDWDTPVERQCGVLQPAKQSPMLRGPSNYPLGIFRFDLRRRSRGVKEKKSSKQVLRHPGHIIASVRRTHCRVVVRSCVEGAGSRG